jgi:GNAT superfamily N-acetyltransferase
MFPSAWRGRARRHGKSPSITIIHDVSDLQRRATRVVEGDRTIATEESIMSPDSGVPNLAPSLRAFMPADAEAAGHICYTAFKTIAERHNFTPDFPDAGTAIGLMHHLAARGDIHGVAAETAGRVVGSNFLWEDGEVAGIGPITIDPAAQNAGLGRRLMRAVIERAHDRGIQRVRLVQAAYHNRTMSLYTKLGFDVREPLSVLQGPSLAVATEGCDVRPAGVDDIAAADALCRRIHGHARSGDLRVAIENDAANVVEREGRITGYTTGIGFFGHAVGETNADLQALIAAATSFAGPGFLLPTRNATLLRWCLQHGLRIVQPMTLMTMGPYQEPRGAFLPSILY